VQSLDKRLIKQKCEQLERIGEWRENDCESSWESGWENGWESVGTVIRKRLGECEKSSGVRDW